MTNDEAVKRALGAEVHRCLWQIVPNELPHDIPPMALELHQKQDGSLHLFQLHVGDRDASDWYRHVEAVTHWEPTE